MPGGHTCLTDLDQTRRLWRSSKFEWGTSDCIMSVCDYVLETTGTDPAAPWRGTYSDEPGARAIYGQYGGVLGLFSFGMELAGFHSYNAVTGAPVVADFNGHELAGICTGRRVMFRMEGRGIVEWPAPILGAWKL